MTTPAVSCRGATSARAALLVLGAPMVLATATCVAPDPAVRYRCGSDQDCPSEQVCVIGRCAPATGGGEDAGGPDAGDSGTDAGGLDGGEAGFPGCPYRVLPFFDDFEKQLDRVAYWKESNGGGAITRSGGGLQISPALDGGSDTYLESAFPFDARERCASAKVVAGDSLSTSLSLVSSSGSVGLRILRADAGLALASLAGSGSGTPSNLVAYDAASMRYLRVCHQADGGWEAGYSPRSDAGWTALGIPGAEGVAATGMKLRVGVSSGPQSGAPAFIDDVNLHGCARPRPCPEPFSVPADDFDGTALDSSRWYIVGTEGIAGVDGGRLFLQADGGEIDVRTLHQYNVLGTTMEAIVSKAAGQSGTLTWLVTSNPRVQIDWYWDNRLAVGCLGNLEAGTAAPTMRWRMSFPADGGPPLARAESLDGNLLVEGRCPSSVDVGAVYLQFHSTTSATTVGDPYFVDDLNVCR